MILKPFSVFKIKTFFVPSLKRIVRTGPKKRPDFEDGKRLQNRTGKWLQILICNRKTPSVSSRKMFSKSGRVSAPEMRRGVGNSNSNPASKSHQFAAPSLPSDLAACARESFRRTGTTFTMGSCDKGASNPLALALRAGHSPHPYYFFLGRR